MTKKIVQPQIPESFAQRLDFSQLTVEEKNEIYERAEKQILKELKTQQEEAFFQHALKRARQKSLPEHEQQDVLVDLPGHAFHILIDGVEYLHAFTYRMDKPKAETVREIIQRAWDHEEEVGGANRSFYHQPSGRSRPRGITLTRAHQGMAVTDINRRGA